MLVAGIDPSLTNTGMAVLDNGQPVYRHSYGEDGHKTDTTLIRNRRMRGLRRYIRDCFAPFDLDLLVIEGPSFGSRYGNPHERGGLYHAVIADFDVRKVPIAIIPPKTRAMWATGRGDADKAAVLAEVKLWWPGQFVANHDEADAFALAAAGAFWLGDPLPFEVKGRHRSALEKVEWPKGMRHANV